MEHVYGVSPLRPPSIAFASFKVALRRRLYPKCEREVAIRGAPSTRGREGLGSRSGTNCSGREERVVYQEVSACLKANSL